MLYSAQPGRKTVANDVIDRMNAVARDRRVPTQIELAAFQRDIQKLKKNNLASYYDLLGMLAALAYDFENVKKHHEAAIRVSGNNPHYRSHYAVSLTKLFLFDKAIFILEELVESDPADLESLQLLIHLAMTTGRYRLANKWIDALSKLCPEKPHDDAEKLKTQIIPYLDGAGLEDSDIANVFDRAMAVLARNQKYYGDVEARWPDDGDDSGLCLIVYLQEPIEIIADLITELCDVEAESGPRGELVNKVLVSFSPMAA